MRKVLTVGSTVTCGHVVPPLLGVVAVASTAKLRVNGSSVLLESSVVGKSVVGCGTPPVQGNTVCLEVKNVTNTPPFKLRVNGIPVLFDTITGATNGEVAGTPQRLLAVTAANQQKLVAT
jgi:hypothetical protein